MVVFFALIENPTILKAANGSFLRTGGGVNTSTDATATAFEPLETVGPNVQTSNSEPIAFAESIAQATANNAFATTLAQETALAPVPVNGNTFTPEATVTSFHQSFMSAANGNSFGGVEHLFERNSSISSGNFQLGFNGQATQGQLHGFLYLVGIANLVLTDDTPSGNAAFIDIDQRTNVSANINIAGNSFGVAASYRPGTSDWVVSGNLPGGVTINLTTASVNHHFDFVVPVAEGAALGLTASNGFGLLAGAGGEGQNPGSGSTASLQFTTSGLAWAVATPNTTPLLAGDFNGNGTVDNNDFNVWRANFGIQIGAGGPQGDANLDGAVDAADYVIWRKSFDAGSGASLGRTEVPEPSTWVAILITHAALTGMLRIRRASIRG